MSACCLDNDCWSCRLKAWKQKQHFPRGNVVLNPQTGVHAAKSFQDLVEHGVIYGVVALWGDIAEHEHGYRAQYGYPVALYKFPGQERIEEIAANYSAEVRSPTGELLEAYYKAGERAMAIEQELISNQFVQRAAASCG